LDANFHVAEKVGLFDLHDLKNTVEKNTRLDCPTNSNPAGFLMKCEYGGRLGYFAEFLTEETTCINEMAKETTSKIICQKRPAVSGGTPGQATCDTCRLGQCRQGLAAVPSSDMLPLQRCRSTP
jgi:hypothetical protein